MGLFLTILVGGFLGWLTAVLIDGRGESSSMATVPVGIVGSGLGRLVFTDLLRIGVVSPTSELVSGLFWGTIGACLFLGLFRPLLRAIA